MKVKTDIMEASGSVDEVKELTCLGDVVSTT